MRVRAADRGRGGGGIGAAGDAREAIGGCDSIASASRYARLCSAPGAI